jgi:hypothetical protein
MLRFEEIAPDSATLVGGVATRLTGWLRSGLGEVADPSLVATSLAGSGLVLLTLHSFLVRLLATRFLRQARQKSE